MAIVFKKEWHPFTEDELKHANAIKDVAEDLYNLIDMVQSSREREVAKVKLEESVMWAMRAISQSR